MKGIILAGGKGSRLYPMTKSISKPLLPIYDKPMIYYPLSVLLMAGIREIIVITAPPDVDGYRRLLGTGEQFGVHIEYGIQYVPRGIADAFLIAEDFIAGDRSCLVLGDNLFYGATLEALLKEAAKRQEGATVFGYPVKNPTAYGVVEFDGEGKVLSLEEKPAQPKSRYAVPGLYFYNKSVCEKAAVLEPSARGEYEITDLNKTYLAEGTLKVKLFGRGFAWLDTGNCDSLLEAGNFIATIQNRQGFYVSCIEEIAWRNGWISTETLSALGKEMKTAYGRYLEVLAEHAK